MEASSHDEGMTEYERRCVPISGGRVAATSMRRPIRGSMTTLARALVDAHPLPHWAAFALLKGTVRLFVRLKRFAALRLLRALKGASLR